MAENNDNKNKDKKGRGFGFTINLSTVFYILLLTGLGWMLFARGGSSSHAVKVEWAEVETMINNGDVAEIDYVRNDYQGQVKIRPERLAKYADRYPGGILPKRSPHFFFLVFH